MSYVITLIARQQVPFLEEIAALRAGGVNTANPRPADDGHAMNIEAEHAPSKALMDDIRARFNIDILCQDAHTLKKRLFVADMEATMIEQEMLDELAAHVGLKEKIAAITARAMNGELEFKDALRERVALLKDLPETALADCASKMTFSPGAEQLMAALKANGIYCVLVSGGFTYFTQIVAQKLGFDEHHGNILNIANGRLSGTVAEPILDKNFKKQCLEDTAKRLNIPLSQTIAIGDGANDLPMLQTAGLGIGWRSKKILRENLSNHLLLNDLNTLVYGLGFTPA